MKKSKAALFTLLICLFANISWASLLVEYRIDGIQDPLLKNVHTRLTAAEGRVRGKLTDEVIRKLYKETPARVGRALQPYGYFNPTVNTELLKLEEVWVFNIHVTLGRPIILTHIDLNISGEGKEDPIINKALKKFPIKEGEIFASEDYSKAKDKLYEVAERRGYIKARWEEHTVLIDEENHSAKIKLNLDTGARYYFGPITFEESRLHPDFLQRYVRFKEGAPYSTSQLIELQESLNQSAYFQRVSIHPQRKKVKDSRIPINIQLVPRKSRLYTFGIGFGTDTGARTSFSWEKTPANQYGHKMQALARLSQVQQNIVARYSIPGRDPAHSQYLLSASYYTNEVRRGDHETEELSAAYISHFGKWEQNASVRVLSERFDLDGQSRETTQIIIPGIHWTRTNADDLINTSEGSRISFGIRGGYSLSSNSQYFQSDIKAKYIHSLTDNDRIILRGELGHTIVHNLEGMPLSQRFFAGGAQNLRGFGYQNLGPGRYLTVASAEYQHRLWGELYGVLFYDVGNAFNHFFDERLREGIGFGFLYRSPVGPLQLTLAWAISEPDYHHKRLEFAMGPDFQ